MRLFKSRNQPRRVVLDAETVTVLTDGDPKLSFAFSLSDVLRIFAVRKDLVTEDIIGLRFATHGLEYDIYEDVDGYAELWRAVLERYRPEAARLAEFQRMAGADSLVELWSK